MVTLGVVHDVIPIPQGGIGMTLAAAAVHSLPPTVFWFLRSAF
jgi:hypothetical protein